MSCQVCHLLMSVRPACGTLLCGACKRFYFRNRNCHEALACVSGRNDCLTDGNNTAMLTKGGLVWRFMCPRCRWHRCRQLIEANSSGEPGGEELVKFKRRKSTNNTKSCRSASTASTPTDEAGPSSQLIIRSPILEECGHVESTYQTLLKALQNFDNSFEQLPFRVRDANFQNDREFAICCMDQYNKYANNVTEFVKLLPGYDDLDVEDRCILFPNSFTQCVIADYTRRAKKRPDCLVLENPCLRKPEIVSAALRKLQMAYDAHLTQFSGGSMTSSGNINNNNSSSYTHRRQRMSDISQALNEASKRHLNAHLKISQRFPEVLTIGRLFSEVQKQKIKWNKMIESP